MNERLENLACRWSYRALWFALLVAPMAFPLLAGEAYFEASVLYSTPMFSEAGSSPRRNVDLYDPTLILYPHFEIIRHALGEGTLPWWKPYNLGGSPLITNGLVGFFYPPRLLLIWLFSTTTAHGLLILIHLFAAGFLMSCLGRRLGLSGLASLFLGTTWMLGGFVSSDIELGDALLSAAWVPGLLILTDECRKGWRPVAFLGLATAGFMLSGHTQYVLNGLLTVLFFGLAMMWQQRCPIGALRAAAGGVLGVCLACPVYLPMAVHMLDSARGVMPPDFIVAVHRQFLGTVLPTFAWPELGGSPVTGFMYHRIQGGTFAFWETVVYAGSVTLILALVGMTRPGLPRFTAVLGLAVLFVPATGVYSLIQSLPGFDRIHTARYLSIFHFCLVVCAAYGFAWMQRAGRRFPGALALLVCAYGLSVMSFQIKAGRFLVNNALAQGWLRLPIPEGARPEYAERVLEAYHNTYSWSNPSFVVPTLTLLLAAVLLLARKPLWVLLIATAAELLFFAVRWNPTVQRDLLYPQTPAIDFLQQRAGIDRVLSLGAYWPNTLTPYRIHSVCGYDSAFFPKTSADYLAALLPPESRHPSFPHFVMGHGSYDPHLANLMGVRYVVVPKTESLDGLVKVHESAVRIYENPDHMPRAFLISDPDSVELLGRETIDSEGVARLSGKIRGKAEIVEYGYNKVVIRSSCHESSWLVFTDAYAPGWGATIDGKAQSVSKALAMFRALPVPEGEHEIVFSYEPPFLRHGLGVALVAFLVVTGLALQIGKKSAAVEKRDDRQRPGAEV